MAFSMYYVYVIQSQKDNKFYTGYTDNIERRIEEHNNGNQLSTKHRRPFTLVYYEASLVKKDAIDRERYLKSGWGKKYLKNRMKYYSEDLQQGACPVANLLTIT